MLTESTLFFVNLTSNFRTNAKFAVAGRIKGWVTNIPGSAGQASSTTPTHS